MSKDPKPLNGYELRQRLKKARRRYPFTATEQALYQELIDMCNEDEWAEVFQCSNEELFRNLNISENTLITARQTLIQQGLIFYKSGKSRRAFSSYSFTKKLTTSNSEGVKKLTTSNSDTNVATNAEVDASADGTTNQKKTTSNSEDYSKQDNTSTNQTETKSSATNVAGGSSEKTAGEKNSKEKKLTLYTECIQIYDVFVRARTEMGAKIDGSQGTAMKNIIAYLSTQARAVPGRTEEDIAIRVKEVWQGVLTNWHLLSQWQQGRLKLTDINSEFQNILTQIKNGTNSQRSAATGAATGKTNGKAEQVRTRGSSIDDLQALKRRGSPGSEERTESADAEVIE